MTHTRYQRLELCHYGMAQRWLVVYSQAALERAEATVNKAKQREAEAIEKQLFHLQAQALSHARGGPRGTEWRWPSAGAITRWSPTT